VEEVELGPKPIEGVATNRAGFVGVTERGPENVPVLVTSYPQFTSYFGGYLDSLANPGVWYLPHAVEGFFQNQGLLAYVVRIAAEGATTASLSLMDRGTPTGYASSLVVRMQPNDTYLVVEDVTGLAPGSWLVLDEGVPTEYVKLAAGAFPVYGSRVRSLRTPTYARYGAGTDVVQLPAIAVDATFGTTLAADAAAGSNRILLTARPAPLAIGDILRLRGAAPFPDEYVVVDQVPADVTDTSVTLRQRLALPHAAATAVDRMTEGAPGTATRLSQAVAQGTSMLVVDAAVTADSVVRIGAGGDPSHAYHVVGQLRAVTLASPAEQAHADEELVTHWTFAGAGGATTLSQHALAGDLTIHVASRAGLAVDGWIEVGAGGTAEIARIGGLPTAPADAVTLRQPLRLAHAPGAAVTPQTATRAHQTTLLQDVPPGSRVLLLSDDDAQFASGAMVTIGPEAATEPEYGPLDRVLSPALLQLDTTVTPGAVQGHAADAELALRTPLLTLHALDRGAWGNRLRVTVQDEEPALVQTTSPSGATAGSPVPLASTSGVERGSLLEVLDWSSRLTRAVPAAQQVIEVQDRTGLAPGNVLRLGRAAAEFATVASLPGTGGQVQLVRPLRRPHGAREWVDRMDSTGLPRMGKVDRLQGANQVVFDGGLSFPVAPGATVRSREFRLTIEWVKESPGGRLRVVESETHRNLSLDDRHSRYIGAVIGSVAGPIRIWDRRPDGGSDLVRVEDGATPDQTESQIRLGPDLVVEVLPGGALRPVPRWLSGGDDRNAALAAADYIGTDDVDPVLRTGLFCLKSNEDISLVAIPGRTEERIQNALIDHCELMRYRVAFLDSLPGDLPTGAMIPEVQAQRQQFDTKRAALYYPWLRIDNPFAGPPLQPAQLSIPPSGSVMGICARTDVTRGVHKAPANEVVLGINEFQRAITKGEQDVLNPEPMNVNVLRDFRLQERGLRVYGARVITSDQEWKYLSVRRLFNFIEQSLEQGTQWVVFEPNDENLWAHVRATIGDFLTSVWRSGGLMGSKPEEAYFVKCDEATNPPQERENGRLHVVVGIAPVFPAEFVIIQIGQWQGGSSVQEG
jgi:phage tail sheath protein FI